jgi:hypothetical protein
MPATSVDEARVSMIPTQEMPHRRNAVMRRRNRKGKRKKVNTAEEESQRMEYAVVSITVSFKS